MSNIYKGEMQDNNGNTIYPHSEADIIFCADGETVQEKLTATEGVLGDCTGKSDSLETDNTNILATTKATHALYEKAGGADIERFEKDPTTQKYGYVAKVEGADTFFPVSSGELKVVDLGTGNNINVSSYEGYEEFTEDNFFCEITTINMTKNQYGNATSRSDDITVTKNYNSATGVFNHSTPNVTYSGSSGQTSYCGANFTVKTYLVYIGNE